MDLKKLLSYLNLMLRFQHFTGLSVTLLSGCINNHKGWHSLKKGKLLMIPD